MVKIKHNIINRILFGIAVFYTSTIAFEIDSVGKIEDRLFAPTSIDVQTDNLAVLEPYSKQIKIYSADGLLEFKMNISGDAYGLTRISDYVYLFCDRERKAVVAVNALNGDQFDYFSQIRELNNPNDILIRDSLVVILDGEHSQLLEINFQGELSRRIILLDSSDNMFTYLSSFTYDPKIERYLLLDQINSSIVSFNKLGEFVGSFGSFGKDKSQITRGGDIAVDIESRIYVTDRFQGSLSVFNSTGQFIGMVDSFGGASSVPTGIAIDENGILYIASTMGNGISIFYVHPSADPFASMSLFNQYPPKDAVISTQEVRFTASAIYASDNKPELFMDFQVFIDTTIKSAVVEATSVRPFSEHLIENSRHRIESNWDPEFQFEDGQNYFWRVRVRTSDTLGAWSSLQLFTTSSLPKQYRLDQNYPNPFNPETKILFSIPDQKQVKIEIYNLLGQNINTILDTELPTGEHEVIWDGRDTKGEPSATGVYFYRLSTDDFVSTKKMVLIK